MRIGISARSVDLNDRKTYVLYKRYIEYFDNCEIVLLLPKQSNDIIEMCDAFILTGGDDLNPCLYNQENFSSNGIDDEIDELDFLIIKHAYESKKTLIGICRGIQSINVFFGGTLKQNFENHMNVNHSIIKNSNSFICDFGESFIVNSYHHQTVDVLGDGLICTYKSIDGVVEVLEHINGNVIGVQYHPEINRNDYSNLLFELICKRKL